MARSQLVDDELWELVKPLLPDRTPQYSPNLVEVEFCELRRLGVLGNPAV
jgi:hypothetical protein